MFKLNYIIKPVFHPCISLSPAKNVRQQKILLVVLWCHQQKVKQKLEIFNDWKARTNFFSDEWMQKDNFAVIIFHRRWKMEWKTRKPTIWWIKYSIFINTQFSLIQKKKLWHITFTCQKRVKFIWSKLIYYQNVRVTEFHWKLFITCTCTTSQKNLNSDWTVAISTKYTEKGIQINFTDRKKGIKMAQKIKFWVVFSDVFSYLTTDTFKMMKNYILYLLCKI